MPLMSLEMLNMICTTHCRLHKTVTCVSEPVSELVSKK